MKDPNHQFLLGLDMMRCHNSGLNLCREGKKPSTIKFEKGGKGGDYISVKYLTDEQADYMRRRFTLHQEREQNEDTHKKSIETAEE